MSSQNSGDYHNLMPSVSLSKLVDQFLAIENPFHTLEMILKSEWADLADIIVSLLQAEASKSEG